MTRLESMVRLLIQSASLGSLLDVPSTVELAAALLDAIDAEDAQRKKKKAESVAWRAPVPIILSKEMFAKNLKLSIDDLDEGLSIRTQNGLAMLGVRTVGDLVSYSAEDLRPKGRTSYLSQRCLREIQTKLADLGLKLKEK